ncbi:MAG: hypothetical protein ABIN45_01440 [Gammaproteobacteria bacterium]
MPPQHPKRLPRHQRLHPHLHLPLRRHRHHLSLKNLLPLGPARLPQLPPKNRLKRHPP